MILNHKTSNKKLVLFHIKKVLQKKKQVLLYSFKKKQIAILNDITSVLRYLDIILITENGIRAIEVKSGDIDNDGTIELAVGAFMPDEGRGAIWILSLDSTIYNIVSKVKITDGVNGFTETLTTSDNPNDTSGANFGHAM